MFYSQALEKPRIHNFCAKCETRFIQWSEYHVHVTMKKCVRVIKPINVSGRSKAQIVIDWESKQKGGVIIK